MSTKLKKGVSYKSESIDSGTSYAISDESKFPDFTAYSILIVEDERSSYQYINAALKRTNATLYWVKDGQSAVEFMQNKKKVDVILMDIKLPIMTGFRATELIKSQLPNIPIIAQTAYAMEGDREKCLNIGCDDYLSKPFNMSKLFNAINDQLNKIPV